MSTRSTHIDKSVFPFFFSLFSLGGLATTSLFWAQDLPCQTGWLPSLVAPIPRTATALTHQGSSFFCIFRFLDSCGSTSAFRFFISLWNPFRILKETWENMPMLFHWVPTHPQVHVEAIKHLIRQVICHDSYLYAAIPAKVDNSPFWGILKVPSQKLSKETSCLSTLKLQTCYHGCLSSLSTSMWLW